MTNDGTARFSSDESLKGIIQYVETELELCRDMMLRMLETKDKSLVAEVSMLIWSANDSVATTLLLANTLRMRDLYVIARLVFETTVNACYLCVEGPDVAAKAFRHALQKTVRDMDRTSRIGDQLLSVGFNGAVELSDELKDALSEFTGRRNQELRHWTDVALRKRIEIVAARFGERVQTALHFPLIAIYRHSSDIIHGTLFGAAFSMNMTNPGSPPMAEDQMREFQLDHVRMVMLMVGWCLDALMMVCGEMFGLSDFGDRSHELSRQAVRSFVGGDERGGDGMGWVVNFQR